MNRSDYFVVNEFLNNEWSTLYENYNALSDDQQKIKILDKLLWVNGLRLKAVEQLSSAGISNRPKLI